MTFVCIENPKKSTRNLHLITETSKSQKIQDKHTKEILFLYTSNEYLGSMSKNMVPFTISVFQKKKYLGVHLTKYA